MLEAIDKKADGRIADALVKAGGLRKGDLADQALLEAGRRRCEAYLREQHSDFTELFASVRPDAEHSAFKAICPPRLGGARKETIIDFALFDSPELEELTRLGRKLAEYGAGPFTLVDGAARHTVSQLDRLGVQLDAMARKGLQIQRYKGLGEMTAEQLWETTMDPAKRTLLEVHVDDINEAERIFSMLMGEAVEPRREFIDQHALSVRNLDV